MNKEEKRKIKQMLRLWGNYDKNLRIQKLNGEELKKIQNRIKDGSDCEIITIESLQKRMAELKKNADYHLSVQVQIEQIVSRMPYDMQMILRTRYVKGTDWECLPLRLPFSISLRQCYRIHLKALEIIWEELKIGEGEHPLSG